MVLDGLEATRRIRALDSPRGRVSIVALTAQAFTEQVAECRQAGMDAHLAKPCTPDVLLAVVGAVEAGRLKLPAVARRIRIDEKLSSMPRSEATLAIAAPARFP